MACMTNIKKVDGGYEAEYLGAHVYVWVDMRTDTINAAMRILSKNIDVLVLSRSNAERAEIYTLESFLNFIDDPVVMKPAFIKLCNINKQISEV